MARIESLVGKLDAEADAELEMCSGKKRREFFIESFGAASVDELIKEYSPDEHNSEWDKERQANPPDPEKLIHERQAIAFMTAGKMGVYKRYSETELSASVSGRSRMIRNKYFLSLSKSLVTMKMYERE